MILHSATGFAVAVTATALVSLGLVRMVIALAVSSGRLDEPGHRQSHTRTTPTGGGLGLVSAVVLATAVLWALDGIAVEWAAAVLPGMSLLAVTGWLDDRRSLSRTFRLAVQLGVSFWLLVFLHLKGQAPGLPGLAMGGIVMVWVMNMYNFMDGSHGMAGFEGVFAGIVAGVVFLQQSDVAMALPAFLVAAACAGFLPWNFPRPRIFMGDSGSVPVGFALGSLLLIGVVRGSVNLPVASLVLAVFLVDSSLTLIQRVIRGERWYTAHRKHVYQRLIAKGWPHSRVLLLYQAINIILVMPAIVLAMMYPEYAWHVAGITVLLLMAGWYSASLRLEVRT